MRERIRDRIQKFLCEHPNVVFVAFACGLLASHRILV